VRCSPAWQQLKPQKQKLVTSDWWSPADLTEALDGKVRSRALLWRTPLRALRSTRGSAGGPRGAPLPFPFPVTLGPRHTRGRQALGRQLVMVGRVVRHQAPQCAQSLECVTRSNCHILSHYHWFALLSSSVYVLHALPSLCILTCLEVTEESPAPYALVLASTKASHFPLSPDQPPTLPMPKASHNDSSFLHSFCLSAVSPYGLQPSSLSRPLAPLGSPVP